MQIAMDQIPKWMHTFVNPPVKKSFTERALEAEFIRKSRERREETKSVVSSLRLTVDYLNYVTDRYGSLLRLHFKLRIVKLRRRNGSHVDFVEKSLRCPSIRRTSGQMPHR